MRQFLSENFLLRTETSEKLFFDYAFKTPIYDYHCHLPVEDIARDSKFKNLSQIWLKGDHYKWRAMRSAGVDEKYITGNASDREKFRAWADTVPKTLRNPLFHWTHLELKRPFGVVGKMLGPETWEEIYETCNSALQKDEFSVRGILKKMDVKVLCTTDDPLDSLEFHRRIKDDSGFDIKVSPAFRPDKALKVDNLVVFNDWVDKLENIVDSELNNFDAFMGALEDRMDFFHQSGCRLSDHGVDKFVFENYSSGDLESTFEKARKNLSLEGCEIVRFKIGALTELSKMSAERGWVQQFHIGALRDNNTRMFQKLGPDSGYDSMGDHNYAGDLARFLDILDSQDKLAKTILYTINPKDNEMLASMIGNFQDGKSAGKMQFGSGWWFNDQKNGMERQINALSNMGLLSQFVGMLTDSRSFLSYPRHEYFRRILCDMFGNDIENGELPNDLPLIGGIIRDICFFNAERYFG